MFYYQLESVAERRARKEKDIKSLFQYLTIQEGLSFMEEYEAVGYRFYEQADAVRKILASKNKSAENPHNSSSEKQYLCTGFPKQGLFNSYR